MSAGRLVLVATPIGNLGELSPRAVETLRTADVVACEDTRHTRKLLNHAGLTDVRTTAVHEHNEIERSVELIERISAGESVAYVTDAGMPGISDPGERLVAAVAAAGHTVSVVSGPSAIPAALAVSGLPTERFCFEGFLPRKGSERRRRIAEVASEKRTVVLYESPHRLAATVGDLGAACGGERRIVLVRELTKLHEEVWRGSLGGLAQRLEDRIAPGESVLVLAGATVDHVEVTDDELRDALAQERSAGASARDAAAEVARRFEVSRRRVYALAHQK